MINVIPTKFQNLRFLDFRSLQATPLKPIRERDVQVRHQIDLTNLGKRGRVELKEIVYRYVLSVMDVFRGVDKTRNTEHSGTFRNIPEHPGT